jgi:arginyl-tRNA synthetase
VEFSSPNIATDFTVAHLRSTILGAFVANIYEAMGWDVVRINYLGDWGEHLGLLGLGWQKYGTEKALIEQTNPIRYIHDLYTKMADELQPEHEARKKARDEGQDTTVLETQGLLAERDATFKRMEEGEPDAIALWKTLRDISIEYYVETYARLNIKFDEYSGESQVSIKPEAIAVVESTLKDRSICEEQDGASIIKYDKYEKRLGTGILRGRNGSTRYLLRDIATVFDRFKTHSFDKMIYVVCEQDVHFRQVSKAVELMGHPEIANKLEHVTFPRAGGPSSALGNAHLLGDILDQCENLMHEFMGTNLDREEDDAVEKIMGINSLLVQQLSSRNAHCNSLSFQTMMSWEGETGPNLQLCYGRLCSAIASIGAHPTVEEIPHIGYSSLWEGPWCELLRLMARYPDVTNSVFKSLEPPTILSYVFRVVEELTNCLDEAEEEESEGEGSTAGSKYVARDVLYENVRQVLENAMKLLGITPISS